MSSMLVVDCVRSFNGRLVLVCESVGCILLSGTYQLAILWRVCDPKSLVLYKVVKYVAVGRCLVLSLASFVCRFPFVWLRLVAYLCLLLAAAAATMAASCTDDGVTLCRLLSLPWRSSLYLSLIGI